MLEFGFKDIKFVDKGDIVRAVFLKHYYFDMNSSNLYKISPYKVEKGKIFFDEGKKVERDFSRLLSRGFNELTNTITGRKTVYIHSNSGIPLIGTSYFGIVDRNTNLIELRPNTACNLNCIYCSLNEGGKKAVDYVVEKDYLVAQLQKLIEFKQDEDIEIHINPQGEPLLYAPLTELVQDVSKIEAVKRISIDTNAVLLTKQKADELINAGITMFNISIDSLNPEKSKEIAGCNYPAEKLKEIISYIAEKGRVIIAPLFLPGINDKDIEELIEFAKKIEIPVGIQNFLRYKHGKNPIKGISMSDFYEKLKVLEKKHNIKLVYSATDFGIHKTKTLPPPFEKEEVVECEYVSMGRRNDEILGVAKDRVIEITDVKKKKNCLAKIIRKKHNIFRATQVG